ncbi:MAG: hypothetical protein O3B65_05300, partial [Chloroflexi bacterium]|nr:hypothetical protein [Chloroflexota bacterium]
IAFVVVASVFAYTVLSAGIFSSEKSKEAIYAGIEQARSSIELVGPVVAIDTDNDDDLDEIVFIVVNSLEGEPINLTTTTDSNGDGLLSDESPQTHSTIMSYVDLAQDVTDLAWTKIAVGKADADDLLEAGEKFEITVDVSHLAPRLNEDDTFILEVRPQASATVVIERTTGAVIDKVNNLR